MFVYKLHLRTTKRIARELELRFYLMWRVHVVIVKHAIRLLNTLEHDRSYQDALKRHRASSTNINALEKELEAVREARKEKKKDKHRKIKDINADIKKAEAEKKECSAVIDATRESLGLTEAGLQEYAKVQRGKYKKHLQSQEIQKEASRVWDGVEKVLFGNGKKLHIPKLNDIRSICGKQKTTGIRFFLDEGKIEWNKLEIACDMEELCGLISPKNGYESIALGEDFSYCEIVRLPFPKGYRYYLHIYMRGEAPDATMPGPDEKQGIDPGVSTMASVSEEGKCLLEELAPDIKRYNREIKKLSTRLEEERRTSNPENYHPDGRIKKGKKTWVRTKKYDRLEMELRSWYRKKTAYVRTSHGTMANLFLKNGIHVQVEKMNYSALAKRSKKTERQDKTSIIKKKDGTSIKVNKYKRKKRFGRSLNNRSPALFLSILKKKAVASGGSYEEVDTRKLRASQYDHVEDKNIKVDLSQRMKTVGEHEVQRDLYSSFIIVNVKADLATLDRERCIAMYGIFIREHDKLITEIKAKKPVRPACFGF